MPENITLRIITDFLISIHLIFLYFFRSLNERRENVTIIDYKGGSF